MKQLSSTAIGLGVWGYLIAVALIGVYLQYKCLTGGMIFGRVWVHGGIWTGALWLFVGWPIYSLISFLPIRFVTVLCSPGREKSSGQMVD